MRPIVVDADDLALMVDDADHNEPNWDGLAAALNRLRAQLAALEAEPNALRERIAKAAEETVADAIGDDFDTLVVMGLSDALTRAVIAVLVTPAAEPSPEQQT